MMNRLPTWLRLYIYGLHGYLIEITFTAVWDFVHTLDWKLKGHSSLWSFLIYGTCTLFLEKSTHYLRKYSVPMWLRSIIYLLTMYTWEFCSGALLSLVNACPWDYSHFRFNLCGLITLEYAPFWMIAGLLAESILSAKAFKESSIQKTAECTGYDTDTPNSKKLE